MRLITWINGVRFMDCQDTDVHAEDEGRIALQVHGGGDSTDQSVRHRNVRVKVLDGERFVSTQS
ncbi:MAG: DUF1080 domain-containing protein [Planctomycetota bacterium]|nr:MAG: DUF1080 domain-containing protein [Planctomycetota bacterium]